MPAVQRGQPYKLKADKGWGLRYYDENGVRRRKSPFPSKSAALAHYREVIEPRRGEWAVAERRDIDRRGGVVRVRRTLSVARRRRDGKPQVQIVELAKTSRSRREVPLSDRALAALDELPPRLDSPYLFAARRGGPFDLHNFRRREWAPAIEASGVARPARLYDMRSTFASNSLAAGVTVFELARVMGTSVAMIERHYGTLLEGAGADIARRLSAFEAERDRAVEYAEDV